MRDYIRDPKFEAAFWDKYTELMEADRADLDDLKKIVPPSRYRTVMFESGYANAAFFWEDVKPHAPKYLSDMEILTKYYFIQKFYLMLYACLKLFDNWLCKKNNSTTSIINYGILLGQDTATYKFMITSISADRITNPDFIDSFKIIIELPALKELFELDLDQLKEQNFELEVTDHKGNETFKATLNSLGQVLKRIVMY